MPEAWLAKGRAAKRTTVAVLAITLGAAAHSIPPFRRRTWQVIIGTATVVDTKHDLY
jgi:hypothetical protein